MMQFVPTEIPGCFEIFPKIFTDERGQFVKLFHQELFGADNLKETWAENYISISKKNVLRGMHFQTPPHVHSKLVYCLSGEVLDVLIDLRAGSPTYSKAFSFELSAEKYNGLYIPIGIAHGFCVLSNSATMLYQTSTVYSPTHDSGISWKSVDLWPIDNPIISDRDESHPLLKDFTSPFVYEDKNK